MNINEDIAKIISNYLLGVITKAEQQVLDDWLKEPNNKFLFNKFSTDKISKEKIQNYTRTDIYDRWEDLQKKLRRNNLKKYLYYAGILIIPLVLILALLNPAKKINLQSINTKLKVSESILLKTSNGVVHEIADQDTIIKTANSLIKFKNNEISGTALNKADLIKYYTLSIPKGKNHKLKLSDGSIVWLNSDSEFKYPIEFKGANRKVTLLKGEAFFDIAKNKDCPFLVKFKKNTIKVLGTQFNIKTYTATNEITLEEGSIVLSNGSSSVELTPNQQAIIQKNKKSILVKNIEANLISSWRNGTLNYKRKSLEYILDDLARVHSLNLFYMNEEVKKKTLSLSISNKDNINEVLKLIEKTGGVRFEIKKQNTIIIKK